MPGRFVRHLSALRPEKLSAVELAERLRDHFAGVGGMACEGELEIGREAVRRARRAERAEAALRQMQRQRRPA
jgi:hypothetical protein